MARSWRPVLAGLQPQTFWHRLWQAFPDPPAASAALVHHWPDDVAVPIIDALLSRPCLVPGLWMAPHADLDTAPLAAALTDDPGDVRFRGSADPLVRAAVAASTALPMELWEPLARDDEQCVRDAAHLSPLAPVERTRQYLLSLVQHRASASSFDTGKLPVLARARGVEPAVVERILAKLGDRGQALLGPNPHLCAAAQNLLRFTRASRQALAANPGLRGPARLSLMECQELAVLEELASREDLTADEVTHVAQLGRARWPALLTRLILNRCVDWTVRESLIADHPHAVVGAINDHSLRSGCFLDAQVVDAAVGHGSAEVRLALARSNTVPLDVVERLHNDRHGDIDVETRSAAAMTVEDRCSRPTIADLVHALRHSGCGSGARDEWNVAFGLALRWDSDPRNLAPTIEALVA